MDIRIYAIYRQPEVADNVVCGRIAKTIEGYVAQNFEVASSSSFLDILKR